MNADEIRLLAHTEENYWWHRGRQRIVRRVLRRYVPSASWILDVGCGPGGTTLSYANAYANGRRVLAVDASPASVQLAHERGLTVAAMDANRLAVRRRACEAIVALDLIEHVDDDAQVLREMYETLCLGGTLVATVPAYQFLWSSHDEAVGHRRRYTRGRLLRLAREAGFEVVLCAYAMSSVLPAAIVIRMAERLRPRRGEPAAKFIRVPSLANAVLERMVGLGPQPLRILPVPFGLSIVLVARRPAGDDGTGATGDDGTGRPE